MGFWVFMLAVGLLIPITTLLLGLRYWRGTLPAWPGPRPTGLRANAVQLGRVRVGFLTGYRTRRSMLSPDTWVYAHRHLGRLWTILGAVLVPPSIVAVVLCFGRDEVTVSLVISVLVVAQAVLLLLSILPTEIALRRHFDGAGQWIG